MATRTMVVDVDRVVERTDENGELEALHYRLSVRTRGRSEKPILHTVTLTREDLQEYLSETNPGQKRIKFKAAFNAKFSKEKPLIVQDLLNKEKPTVAVLNREVANAKYTIVTKDEEYTEDDLPEDGARVLQGGRDRN